MIPNDIKITPELVAQHGLKPDEYERFLALLGREPTITELGIVSAMWNEHCSYKSSKVHLKTLPTKGPRVIHGPGENAGVVDIGDGEVVVFKMESHNHPSYIEPYQGAGTGVGGILRDVFTMGARPIAALNALRFGDRQPPQDPASGFGRRRRHRRLWQLLRRAHRGRAGRLSCALQRQLPGQCHGGGHRQKGPGIFTSQATGVGLPIVYLGSKTGRDGIHGATMARPNLTRIRKKSARPCKSATLLPKNCCSKPALKSWPKAASSPFRTWARRG
jgi:phosphoribosylformylglycinamidine (FGAM) synthase-like enzyme